MNKKEVLKQIKADIKQAGSQAAHAKQIGVSPQFLSDFLKGRRGISEALGYKQVEDWYKVK